MGTLTTQHGALQRVIALSVVALLLVFLFYQQVTLPLEVGLGLLLGLTVWSLISVRPTQYSVLPRLMVILYVLPFTILIPYLWDPQFQWTFTQRQTLYANDRILVAQMIAVGTAGLLGLLVGLNIARLRPTRPRRSLLLTDNNRWGRTLNRVPFAFLLLVAWLLSWFAAPTKNIFAVPYFSPGTQAQAEHLNFNAAYLVSYVLLVLLFIDAERDTHNRNRRVWKYRALLATVALIVVYLQVLRGNRESSGLIAALVALYLTGPHRVSLRLSPRKAMRKRATTIAVPVLALALTFIALGSARSSLSKSNSGTQFSLPGQLGEGWAQSTWKGVLLTNLSIAGQYRFGQIQYLYGQTYLDYVLSLPPGPVTALLGFDRPLERDRGPALWTKDIASGGMHIIIVPFKNFGIAGCFVVLCFYGYAIARLDQHNDPGSFWGRFMFGTAVTSSFLWFWLGDISMVRALIVAGILGLVYQTACGIRPVAAPSSRSSRIEAGIPQRPEPNSAVFRS